jgi:hypothetical protein
MGGEFLWIAEKAQCTCRNPLIDHGFVSPESARSASSLILHLAVQTILAISCKQSLTAKLVQCERLWCSACVIRSV